MGPRTLSLHSSWEEIPNSLTPQFLGGNTRSNSDCIAGSDSHICKYITGLVELFFLLESIETEKRVVK